MEPVRACPICPDCGSKRFTRIPSEKVTVKCRNCEKIFDI